ncbi:MAG: tyrosine-type recombinase/integrase [Candidatus Limnocylindria bacterium]
MLSTLFPKAYRRYTSLPVLGPLADAFDTWLVERGFRRGTRKQQLGAVRRIDRALRRRGRHRSSDVTHDDLEVCWSRSRRRGPNDPASVRNLQRFLEQRALLSPAVPTRVSQVETLTNAYAGMLCDLRGLAPTTVHQHVRTAQAFLEALAYETTPAHLAGATAADIERFVRDTGSRLSRASLQHTVAQLRSFLRFLASRDRIRSGLDEQIDTPRCYRLEQLPRNLPWATVQAFLRAIDRTTLQGLRDYTMFYLIATYGLRACEVVSLTLDAIDWRRRLLRVAPRKRGTPLLLPLTDDAGATLVRYLRRGRPASPWREVFLRARAPAGILKPTAVGEAFQTWVRRSGLPIPFQGPHCLRHSYALHLLRQGVSLKTLGDLLGHRLAESTCVYLRLDTDDLRGVALAVPRPAGHGSRRERPR